jgi:predicted GNAT superfamily acetyltransferase
MVIRQLTALTEYEKCLELQRDGFGWSDADLMPVRFFVVTHHIGGLVLGAFDGENLVGFLSSIPAMRNRNVYWHSHMLVVAHEYRNKGTGVLLKMAQREQAIQHGIPLIEWTFDPMESKNAYFNFEKLGAVVRRYYPNFYGSTTGVQGNLPTDRIVAEWWLDRDRPAVTGELRRIAIPSDIQKIKRKDLEEARAIQERLRFEFQKNLSEGFFAAAFSHNAESSEYVFIRRVPDAAAAD